MPDPINSIDYPVGATFVDTEMGYESAPASTFDTAQPDPYAGRLALINSVIKNASTYKNPGLAVIPNSELVMIEEALDRITAMVADIRKRMDGEA